VHHGSAFEILPLRPPLSRAISGNPLSSLCHHCPCAPCSSPSPRPRHPSHRAHVPSISDLLSAQSSIATCASSLCAHAHAPPTTPTSSNPRPSIGVRPALRRWKVTNAGMVRGRPRHPRPAPRNLLPSTEMRLHPSPPDPASPATFALASSSLPPLTPLCLILGAPRAAHSLSMPRRLDRPS
jgi:hypothetical protein